MNKLFAANWKMHKTTAEARQTAAELVGLVSGKLKPGREVMILPPYTALAPVAEALRGAANFLVGAQNFYPQKQGAFTGEVSPGMLLDVGASFALTGHSERRHVLGETDALVGAKTAYGLENGLGVILCVGEKLEERKAGELEAVLERQIRAGLQGVPLNIAPERLALAYEPVWAIGTGEVAGPKEIVEAHAFVRRMLTELYGAAASELRILYGGSVKPDNASDIIALDNVDGVLVGGASLKADEFSRIVLA